MWFIEGDETVLYATLEDGVMHRQFVKIEGLIENMCARLQRDLTPVERDIYELDDSHTCPKFAES